MSTALLRFRVRRLTRRVENGIATAAERALHQLLTSGTVKFR